MFSFNPELADADDMEDGDEAVVSYARSDDENEENENMYRELNLDLISLEASEVIYIIFIDMSSEKFYTRSPLLGKLNRHVPILVDVQFVFEQLFEGPEKLGE